MTLWREIEEEDSGRWILNPYPLAIGLCLVLWAAIYYGAWLIVELW